MNELTYIKGWPCSRRYAYAVSFKHSYLFHFCYYFNLIALCNCSASLMFTMFVSVCLCVCFERFFLRRALNHPIQSVSDLNTEHAKTNSKNAYKVQFAHLFSIWNCTVNSIPISLDRAPMSATCSFESCICDYDISISRWETPGARRPLIHYILLYCNRFFTSCKNAYLQRISVLIYIVCRIP